MKIQSPASDFPHEKSSWYAFHMKNQVWGYPFSWKVKYGTDFHMKGQKAELSHEKSSQALVSFIWKDKLGKNSHEVKSKADLTHEKSSPSLTIHIQGKVLCEQLKAQMLSHALKDWTGCSKFAECTCCWKGSVQAHILRQEFLSNNFGCRREKAYVSPFQNLPIPLLVQYSINVPKKCPLKYIFFVLLCTNI